MALSSALMLSVNASQTLATDLGGPITFPLTKSYSVSYATGTGAGQADLLYQDTNTLTASATLDIDLAGVLTTPVGGGLVTFARIKGLVVAAAAANTNNVIVGGAAATQFIGPFGAATHTIALRPGEFKVLIACGVADAVGYPVTAGASDFLRITNGAAGTSVTYDIVIIGCSA